MLPGCGGRQGIHGNRRGLRTKEGTLGDDSRVRASEGPWDGEEPAWAGREAGRQWAALKLQSRSPGVQAGRQQEAVGDF